VKVTPTEVVTDAAAVYPDVLDELIPSAWHHAEQHANNPIEADHNRLKHRLRPIRGLQTDRTTQVIIAGHAFLQNPGAATTNSASTPRPLFGSLRRSANSPGPSDLRSHPGYNASADPTTQRRPLAGAVALSGR
jgi:hypothetical protein